MVLATLFIISHGYHLILSKRLRSRDITWLTKVGETYKFPSKYPRQCWRMQVPISPLRVLI